MVGTLTWLPATEHPELLAAPVTSALARLDADAAAAVRVAAIDPDLADTAAFCDAYGVGLGISANCVVVAAKLGGGASAERRLAACVVLATTRADVNGVVRRHLEARKVSFAPMDQAVAETGMEYGGITPLGLPDDWALLVDAAVDKAGDVVVGSGLRASKLLLPGSLLGRLPSAVVLPDLAT